MERAEANGSFLIKSTGAVEYIGSGGGNNQIVTYNPDNESFEDTDLENLFNGACVSQFEPSPPTERPNEDDLEIGDFWTNSNTKILSIWSAEEGPWVFVNAVNGNPIGCIIESISQTPPSGYLACDGTPCPTQYVVLNDMLIQNTGSRNLPNRGVGFYIKF